MGTNIQGIHNKGKEFPKGVSGNPKGRPPKTINAIMRELGEGTLLDCKYRFEHKGEIIERSISFESIDNKRKYKAAINEVVASQVIKQAIAGDIQSQKMLIDAQNPTVSAGAMPESIQPPNVTFISVDMSNNNGVSNDS